MTSKNAPSQTQAISIMASHLSRTMADDLTSISSVEDWAALMDRQEPLDPTLEPYLHHSGSFPALQHPLVYGVPYFEGLNATYNHQLRHKQAALSQALAQGTPDGYHRYVFLHERPHRLDAFHDLLPRLDDPTYWALLAEIWIDTENSWQNLLSWYNLLTDTDRHHREAFMSLEDQATLAFLPTPVRVYRGYSPRHGNRAGISWTLSRTKARWFANRWSNYGSPKGRVASLTVPRSAIIAYLSSRGEQEVLVDPLAAGLIHDPLDLWREYRRG